MINILPTESSSEPVNLTESPSKQQSKYFHAPITNPINSNQLNEDEENENDYINIDSNVTVTPDHPTIDIVIAFKEHLERKVTTSRTTSEISTSNIIKGRIVEGVHGEKISFDTIVEKIHRAGLYTVEVRSLRKWDKTHKLGYIYLGVGATERRLILCADDIKYKLLGNPVELKRMAESGRPGVWEPIYTLYPATGQFANWETSLYPSVEDNSFFEKRMEDIVYSEMKTNQLPSIQKFCEHGKDATMTPSLTPFQYIYLPVETFSLCQKPGLNKNNPDERKEKHVRLVCPPSIGNEYKKNKDKRREYYYDLYTRVEESGPNHGSLFRSTDRQRLVMQILTGPVEEKQFGISQGSGLDFNYLLRAKVIKDLYCLHDDVLRNDLLQRWGEFHACCICCHKKKVLHKFGEKYQHCQTSQNLFLLRNYYGEKAAMYFGFVEHLIQSTYHLSILGVGMFIWQIIHFFTEIERRNVAGFIQATNATREEALSMLTSSCSLYSYVENYGGNVVASTSQASTVLCPSEYFNLTSALLLYNSTYKNVTIFSTINETINYTRTFESEWNFNSTAMLPFLALIVWVYSLLTVVFWRRKQKRYALEWGTNGCEQDESLRWSYKNHPNTHQHIHPVNGSLNYVMYPCRRLNILCKTRSTIFALLLAVFSGVVSIVILRAALTSSLVSEELQNWAGIICGVANAVWITIMGVVWQKISVQLNDAGKHYLIHGFCFEKKL
jgi:hypothetical protein